MAEVKESFYELAEADIVPERDYMMIVISAGPVGDKGWEMAQCGFDNPPDKELVGRRVSYFLGREGNWRSLGRLLQAAKLFDLPIKDGKQSTEGSLPGVKFPAHVFRGMRDGMPQNQLAPNVDYDWVEANAPKEAGRGGKKTSRKTSKKKAAPRRRRRG